MNHLIQIAWALLILLASCQGPVHQASSNDKKDQIDNDLADGLFPIVAIDTITNPYAPSRITRKVKQDGVGNLLIAAFDDIVRYDGNSFTHLAKKEGLDTWSAFDVLEDKEGNIWIASNHSGAFKVEASSGLVTNFTTDDGLASNRNMFVYEDQAGQIWFAGENGLSCYDGVAFKNYTLKEGAENNNVSCIMQDNTGKLWFGTRRNTFIYDGKTFKEITNDEGKHFTNTWSILEDRKGDIWIGGESGLWRYNNKLFTNISKDFVICVYEDKNGNIWSSSPQGVIRLYPEKMLDQEKVTGVQVFKNNGPFLGLSEDKKGNIWFGGGSGLWRYTGKTVHYFTGVQTED